MSLLTETLERIFKHLQQNRPEVASLLKPGLKFEEIQSKIRNLPFRLPEEVYELYQWRNGIDSTNISRINLHLDSSFIPHFDFIPLEQAIEDSKEIEEFRHEYTSLEDKNCHKPWFPIFGSDDLEYFLVFGDSDNNKYSSIMQCHLGGGSLPKLKYPNLTTFMLIVAECYETNAYYLTELSEENYFRALLKRNTKQFAEIERKYFIEELEELIKAISQPKCLLSDNIFNTLYRFKEPRFVEPMIHILHLPLSEVDNEE